ncbi:hypothetical protein HDV03_002997 [Kappamyces sp. JEL0829]|nr:hypothetical protein HDV03_002997 [Kappamyces sp. JEL0829]
MGWEEEILSHIEPSAGAGGAKRKRGKRVTSSDDDSDYNDNKNSDLEPIDSDEDDAEWAEVSSWNKSDLMGDSKDRKRLFAMSELEREMELAERRKKLDALEERMILKKRLKSQSQRRNESVANDKLTDRQRKGQTLELLKKKRANKVSGGRTFEADAKSKKKKGYDLGSDEEDEYGYDGYDDEEEEDTKKKREISYEDALSIQLTRDNAEAWLYRPDFENTIKGCFVRLSLGSSGPNREPVYRCVYVADTPEYHRKYKLNNSFTKVAINVTHGKAKKLYLMDMVSNQPITTKEWNRYEVVVKTEKAGTLPTMRQIERKRAELDKIKSHVFTEAEFNEMLAKKKELKQAVTNYAFERVRLETALEAARNAQDFDKLEDLKLMLKDLEEAAQMEASGKEGSAMAELARLNEKNRKINLNEIQEAEKAYILSKRTKGTANESDPFARRKTAPTRVVLNAPPPVDTKKEVIPDPEVSASVSRSATSVEELPYHSDDEDPFAALDVSLLEGDLASSQVHL